MALETMRGVKGVGGFNVMSNEDRPTDEEGNVDWVQFDKMRDNYPVCIDHEANMISFKLQNGPVKENGVNGCQVDTLIATASHIIKKLDDQFPCMQNTYAISHLGSALHWLNERTKDREKRNVEGQSKA